MVVFLGLESGAEDVYKRQGVDHAQGEDVLGRGHTCVLFEIVYKPVGADVQGFRDVYKRQ